MIPDASGHIIYVPLRPDCGPTAARPEYDAPQMTAAPAPSRGRSQWSLARPRSAEAPRLADRGRSRGETGAIRIVLVGLTALTLVALVAEVLR